MKIRMQNKKKLSQDKLQLKYQPILLCQTIGNL